MCHDWPKPPISPEDLPLIRELLIDEEYAELLRRMVQLLPERPAAGLSAAVWRAEQELKGPSAAKIISESRKTDRSDCRTRAIHQGSGHRQG